MNDAELIKCDVIRILNSTYTHIPYTSKLLFVKTFSYIPYLYYYFMFHKNASTTFRGIEFCTSSALLNHNNL